MLTAAIWLGIYGFSHPPSSEARGCGLGIPHFWIIVILLNNAKSIECFVRTAIVLPCTGDTRVTHCGKQCTPPALPLQEGTSSGKLQVVPS